MSNEELIRMREKISEMHTDMYKAMLGLVELPEPLLKRYFVIKKLLDKIDGRLSAADLIRIAMDVGLNPETVRFEETLREKKVLVIDKTPTPEQMDAIADPTGTVVAAEPEVAEAPSEPEPDRAEPATKPPKTLNLEPGLAAATDDDDVIDPANPDYSPGEDDDKPDEPEPLTGDDIPDGPEPEPAADDEPTYAVGAEVKVFIDGQVKDGTIQSVDGETYIVEVDGETHEVFEEDIDV